MPSSALEVRGLWARYGDVAALRNVDLAASTGEFVAVVGPSGCGKTTLLRCLAGFAEPWAGSICLGDEVLADAGRSLPPERRGIGIVFQNYALWPHMTALDNVAYPWKVRGVGSGERGQRAAALLAKLGLAGFERRRPAELSGGQQQRVALARALACEPRLLLLDEPLSNVDATLRLSLQDLIADVVHENALTTILATHDLDEAFTLADRVAILRDGVVVQAGSPTELSARPANGFVARFLGGMNVIPVEITDRPSGGTAVRLANGNTIQVACEAPSGTAALLCIRPEHICLSGGSGTVTGVIGRARLRAGVTEYRLRVGTVDLRATEPGPPRRSVGDEVHVTIGEALLLPPEE